MHIYIFCNGSRGDCEPGIAVAQELIKKENTVHFFINRWNTKLLEKSGFPFTVVLESQITKMPHELSIYHYARDTIINSTEHINKIYEILKDDSYQKPDAVLGIGDQLSKTIAEYYKIPYMNICMQYFNVPDEAKRSSTFQYVFDTVEQYFIHLYAKPYLSHFNQIRQKLNLKPVDNMQKFIMNNQHTLVANSLILHNCKETDISKINVIGNIDINSALDPSLDELGLPDWLEAPLSIEVEEKPRLIFITLGSLSQKIDRKLRKLYLDTFSDIDAKIVINGTSEEDFPEEKFRIIRSLNHHQIISKADLVIHCGGIGVAFKAAKYAKPQMILHKNFEEDFWLEKVEELGIGSGFAYSELTSKIFNQCIKKVLNNKMYFSNAKLVSEHIYSNGATKTVEFIEDVLSSAAAPTF